MSNNVKLGDMKKVSSLSLKPDDYVIVVPANDVTSEVSKRDNRCAVLTKQIAQAEKRLATLKAEKAALEAMADPTAS